MLYFLNKIGKNLNSKEGKRTWVQLLRPGIWKHDEYGKLNFNAKFFDKVIENFDNNVRKIELAIDAEHKPEDGACGWIKKLENRGEEGLWALVDWTKKGVNFLKDGIYKYLSVEFDNKWTDEETGKEYKNVLFGAALTNRPFIKGMEAVNLSEFKKEALEGDENLRKLVEASEKIVKTFSDGDKTMKKCEICGNEFEGEGKICPSCMKKADEKLTEEGDNAKINQTGSKADKTEHEQAKDREKKEKAMNKGTVIGKGFSEVKNVKVFKDDNGEMYYFEEDFEEDMEKKEEEKEKKKEENGDKKLQEDEEEKEKKKEEKEEKKVEMHEIGVVVATKKLSDREKATIVSLNETKDDKARKVLAENAKFLRDSRVTAEKKAITDMLNEHFLDGKLTPVEKNMWQEVLHNEAPQADVAVFKLSEGEGDKKSTHFRPLSYIVDKMLSERPVIVELKEMAHNDEESARLSEEEKEKKEAAAIAKRLTDPINKDEKVKKALNEK